MSSTLRPFRADLEELYAALRPQNVACLFAESLADVPVDTMLRGGSEVTIVDWMPTRPRAALASTLVKGDASSGYACLACEGAGHRLCGSFTPPPEPTDKVCPSFVVLSGSPPQCARYVQSELPRVVLADGSLGRAACFATRAEEIVAKAGKEEDAFEGALAEAARCASVDRRVDVANDSIDLAISLLAPARLAAEPLGHFDELMVRRFGPSRGRRRERLAAQLRSSLSRMQLLGHLRELHRVLKKDGGRAYFATEPFRAGPAEAWSLPMEIPLTFEVARHYFDFDFSLLGPARFLRVVGAAGLPTMLQAAVLAPRSAVGEPTLWAETG